ncbi:MAG: ABC transporter ATP-binding protein, partial [Bacteroidia bacterium]|nr:ABC transporter ATP-binding protein [Bacteroidia bacterium]
LKSHETQLPSTTLAMNIERVKDKVEFYTYKDGDEVKAFLHSANVEYSSFEEKKMSLEDAFIGLTSKY